MIKKKKLFPRNKEARDTYQKHVPNVMLTCRDFPYLFQVSQLNNFYLICFGDLSELQLLFPLGFKKQPAFFLTENRMISQTFSRPYFFPTCDFTLGCHRYYDHVK